MTATKLSAPDDFLTLGFPGFSSVVTQMRGNLCTAHIFSSHSIVTIIIFPSSTDRRDRRNWPGACGLAGQEPIASAEIG